MLGFNPMATSDNVIKVLHLLHDDKFTEFIVDKFEACENVVNTFLIVVANVSHRLRYVSHMRENMHLVSVGDVSIRQMTDWADCLVIHYLDEAKARIVGCMPKRVPIFWSGWGGDYYDRFFDENQFYGEKTRAAQFSLNKAANPFWVKTWRRARQRIKKIIVGDSVARILNNIDYFSSPVPEDFELVKASCGENWHANYLQINYGSVEETFMRGANATTGNDILVGNSATPTNNHLEIFEALSNTNLRQRRVIVPLSYGDSAYRDLVLAVGNELFGNRFVPIVNFISLDEYNELISACAVAVMGHRRQQAIGNTATMLYKGAIVYLDERSTVYQFFVSRGAHIFSLQDMNELPVVKLTETQRNKNRDVLTGFWADAIVQGNTQHAIEVLRQARGVFRGANN